jgi:hypothetical protein
LFSSEASRLSGTRLEELPAAAEDTAESHGPPRTEHNPFTTLYVFLSCLDRQSTTRHKFIQLRSANNLIIKETCIHYHQTTNQSPPLTAHRHCVMSPLITITPSCRYRHIHTITYHIYIYIYIHTYTYICIHTTYTSPLTAYRHTHIHTYHIYIAANRSPHFTLHRLHPPPAAPSTATDRHYSPTVPSNDQ